MKKLYILALLFASIALFTACKEEEDEPKPADPVFLEAVINGVDFKVNGQGIKTISGQTYHNLVGKKTLDTIEISAIDLIESEVRGLKMRFTINPTTPVGRYNMSTAPNLALFYSWSDNGVNRPKWPTTGSSSPAVSVAGSYFEVTEYTAPKPASQGISTGNVKGTFFVVVGRGGSQQNIESGKCSVDFYSE